MDPPTAGSASLRANGTAEAPRPLGAAVWLLAAAKVSLHLAAPSAYGLFVDELYFLACGEHLAFGYVDMPPLTALQARLATTLFGHSVTGIHLFPALMGGGLVLLVALLARELGGRRGAQALAALCVVVAPYSHVFFSYLSMNGVEPLVWTGCALLVTRIVRTGRVTLWPWVGLLAGIGLLNKHTMLLFGLALAVGIASTGARRLVWNRWFLAAGLVALALFLPNLVWEVGHGFPHLEQLANIRRNGRDVQPGPVGFLLQQVVGLHPLTFPVWAGGLVFTLSGRKGRPFRFLGVAWLAVLVLLLAMGGRFYYFFPAHPLLLAAGAVWWEELAATWRRLSWAGPAYAGLLLVTGAVIAPATLPILPPDGWIAWSRVTGLSQPRIENRATVSPLPQLFADRCGWKEMAEAVATAYFALPPAERERTAIFGNDYGQAGAIDFYGPGLGLPKAIGGHLTYWLWGPRGYTGESVLVLGDRRERLDEIFSRVEAVARIGHPNAMRSQQFTLFLCRQPKGWTFSGLWPRLKQWN